MGYTAQLVRPVWPDLAPLPQDSIFYQAPDSAAWTDAHRRREYRRSRIARHRLYQQVLSWSRSMLGADISRQLETSRSAAERAWLLDEELGRRFEHRRPRFGPCECELLYYSDIYDDHWWPFPEDEFEDDGDITRLE